MRRFALATAFIASVAVATACTETPEPVAPPPPAATPPPSALPKRETTLKEAGIETASMERGADACNDFYQLACGGLLKNIQIPPEEAAWGPAWELQRRTEEFLRDTLEKDAKAPGDDAVKKKLGAFYGSCMDEAAAEKAGIKPLKPLLDIVAKVHDRKSLELALTELHKRRIWPLFDIASQQDFKDATLVIAGLDQDGLGLPDRDYYLDNDAKTKDVRAFYVGHVERMFGLAGDKGPAAKKAAEDVMRIETAAAKLAQDKVVRRDPYKIYNKIDRKGLADKAKGMNWDAYFSGLGFPAVKDISVNSVSYFEGIDALMANEKPEAWKSYLKWKVLESQGARLTKAFVDERFKLRQRLMGQKELQPRWKRCVRATDASLGELLAQEYVKAKFDGESKQAATDVLKGVRDAMRAELLALPWMDKATVAAAGEKLGKMNDKIGYPAKWRSYDFAVSPTDYEANALASEVFEGARSLAKVGKPVDRDEWQMTPPTVNAYYDPSLNEMVFPAGILQPPLFDKRFIAAVNFGGTGGVMGHELTHGFDDQGSQFDGAGNLTNWWSAATAKQFGEQTKCVADQYGHYEAVPGVKLNGDLTLGENIADIGGVKLAFAAYRAARKDAKEQIVADGYTEDQVFFLAFGQSWCEKDRPEYLELVAKTNPHSPARFRVDGVLADVTPFADAFSCKVGTPMHPAKTCAVW